MANQLGFVRRRLVAQAVTHFMLALDCRGVVTSITTTSLTTGAKKVVGANQGRRASVPKSRITTK